MGHSANWIGFFELFKKEVLRFIKVISQTLWSPIVNAILYMIVFGLGLKALVIGQQFSYLEFLIPGLVALASLNNALQNSSSSVMVSKFHGDLQDLRLIPLNSLAITIAYAGASVVRGFITGAAVFAVGQIFAMISLGHMIPIQNAGALIYFLIFGCLIFGNLGTFIGFSAKSFEYINNFTTFIILPLLYLGGVFFSTEHLHPILKAFVSVNPLFYIINGFRFSILGVADISVFLSFVTVAIFAILSTSLAYWAVCKGSYQRF